MGNRFVGKLRESIVSRRSITTPEFRCSYVMTSSLSQQLRSSSIIPRYVFLVYPHPVRNPAYPSCPRNNFADDNNWNESRSYAYTRHRTSWNWHKFRAVRLCRFICPFSLPEDKWFLWMPEKNDKGEGASACVVGRTSDVSE